MKNRTFYSLIPIILLGASALFSDLRAQAVEMPEVADDSTMMVSPIETDRPDQSESASILPKGYFQMENGFSIQDIKPGFIYTYPSTLWKVSVSEYFEFRVLTEYINITHEGLPDNDGLLPVKVGFKTKLFNQNGWIPKAAILGFISLPGIASKQFQTTYFAPSITLAFQHLLADRFSISYNAGASWNGEDARPDFLYTFTIGADVYHGLGAYIEAYGDGPQQQPDDFKHRLGGGLTYLVSRDVLVDVSGGIGLSDNAPERYVAVGLSYRFKM
ncbi:MAG: transporter [Saprospiraceae bacterium]